MVENNQLHIAIRHSVELLKQGEDHKALEFIDDAIAKAVLESDGPAICLLSQHAAVIADSRREWGLARRYYEQILAYAPEDALTLYGLAGVLFEQGETDLGTEYAARAYALVAHSNTEEAQRILELINKKWPEIEQWRA